MCLPCGKKGRVFRGIGGFWGRLLLRSTKGNDSIAELSTMSRRGGRVVEGARLLSGCTVNPVPRVQIPPSPLSLLYSADNKIL